ALLTPVIYGPFNPMFVIIIIGILLIPNISRAIANKMDGEINVDIIFKAMIKQIPYNFAIALLIFHSIGFLGFNQSMMITLGGDINVARENPYEAPWAGLWPGITIFGIVITFLILHIGLQEYTIKNRMGFLRRKKDFIVKEI
ncbi:MAG: hypothetical protein ACFFE4_05740, partial [Candidatus Thorarchaeota archaeon]